MVLVVLTMPITAAAGSQSTLRGGVVGVVGVGGVGDGVSYVVAAAGVQFHAGRWE